MELARLEEGQSSAEVPSMYDDVGHSRCCVIFAAAVVAGAAWQVSHFSLYVEFFLQAILNPLERCFGFQRAIFDRSVGRITVAAFAVCVWEVWQVVKVVGVGVGVAYGCAGKSTWWVAGHLLWQQQLAAVLSIQSLLSQPLSLPWSLFGFELRPLPA